MTSSLKTYRAPYLVTLTEWYEIEATSKADAEERAYCEGVQVDQLGNPCDRGVCHDAISDGDAVLVMKQHDQRPSLTSAHALRCPSCAESHSIEVEATVGIQFEFDATGREIPTCDNDWDYDECSPAYCRHCDHDATLAEFRHQNGGAE